MGSGDRFYLHSGVWSEAASAKNCDVFFAFSSCRKSCEQCATIILVTDLSAIVTFARFTVVLF